MCPKETHLLNPIVMEHLVLYCFLDIGPYSLYYDPVWINLFRIFLYLYCLSIHLFRFLVVSLFFFQCFYLLCFVLCFFQGAFTYHGSMIDMPSLKQAQNIVTLASAVMAK